MGVLSVKDRPGGTLQHQLFVGNEGEWPFPLKGRTYRISRSKLISGVVTELYSNEGGHIPEGGFIQQVGAPVGSVCPEHHGTGAAAACARCGVFVCERCLAPDRLHCLPCLQRRRVEALRQPSEAAYFLPVVFLGIFGGLIGIILGATAGALSLAIARRLENRALRLIVAIGAYGVAAGLAFVIGAAVASMKAR